MTFIKLVYDTSGKLIGFIKDHATIKVDADTLTASGTFVVTDPSGKVGQTGTSTATATRIKVEGA